MLSSTVVGPTLGPWPPSKSCKCCPVFAVWTVTHRSELEDTEILSRMPPSMALEMCRATAANADAATSLPAANQCCWTSHQLNRDQLPR